LLLLLLLLLLNTTNHKCEHGLPPNDGEGGLLSGRLHQEPAAGAHTQHSSVEASGRNVLRL
jgi:hypothetical protein